MIIAGNWKMNLSPIAARDYLKTLMSKATTETRSELVLFPPALLAQTVSETLQDTPVRWGGQNCHFESKGAFTGENSPQTLKEMGAKICLVGHSERRHVFGETDELLAKKVQALQKLDLIPVLCVGEKIEERQAQKTESVIVHQLREGLKLASPDKPLWIAYEPVWAIGTGLVASVDQVADAHAILRKALMEWAPSQAARIPILYGGSVKSDNAGGLAVLPNVDGFLIGGASLDPVEFLKIQTMAQS